MPPTHTGRRNASHRTPQASLRARLAVHSRHHPDDSETLDGLRRDLRAAMLEQHIRQVVDEAPPLTVEQRDRLSTLLAGAARDTSNDAG